MNVMPVKNYISDCDDAKITRLQQSLPPPPLLNPDQRTPLCSYFWLGNIWCVTWTVCRLHCLALLLKFLWNEGPLRVDSNRRDDYSAECSRWPPSHYLLSSSKQDRGLPPLHCGQIRVTFYHPSSALEHALKPVYTSLPVPRPCESLWISLSFLFCFLSFLKINLLFTCGLIIYSIYLTMCF